MKIVNRLMLALFNFVTNLSLAYHFEDLQKSRLAKHSDSNDKVHTHIQGCQKVRQSHKKLKKRQ